VVVEKLNQTMKAAIQKRHNTCKNKIKRVLKAKMGKQSNTWTVYQYIRSTDGQLCCEEDTFLWLSMGVLKAETESEIIAAQDLALQTK
jgi:hypothetical protein